jgi:hypothetical protein
MLGKPDIYIDGLKNAVLSGNWNLGKEDVAILQGRRTSCGLSYVLVSIFPDPLVLDVGDCKGNLIFQFYLDGIAIMAPDRAIPQAWFYKQHHLSQVELIKDKSALSGYSIMLPGDVVAKEIKPNVAPVVTQPAKIQVTSPPPIESNTMGTGKPIAPTSPTVIPTPMAPRFIEPPESLKPMASFTPPVNDVVPREEKIVLQTNDNYQVQFLAESSEVNAQNKMDLWKTRYPDLFNNRNSRVIHTILNGKDYWRLRFVNISTHQEAIDICNLIQKKGQECFVPND